MARFGLFYRYAWKSLVLILCTTMLSLSANSFAQAEEISLLPRSESAPAARQQGSIPGEPEPDSLIAYFIVTPDVNKLTLSWATAMQLGVQGFNVYRSTVITEYGVQVNAEFIPVDPFGSGFIIYEYDDFDAEPGQLYFYWLELVSTYGGGNFLGPRNGLRPFSTFVPVLSLF